MNTFLIWWRFPMDMLKTSARFGFDLLADLAAQDDAPANIAISPASIAAMLAVVAQGADAELRTAITRTLRLEGEQQLAGLRAALRTGDRGPLALVNALFFDPQSEPRPQAVALLREAGVLAEIEDLTRLTTIEMINQLVERHTRGLIPSILEAPLEACGLVLLNALHFKDDWLAPFEAELTRDADFHLANGRRSRVALMQSPAGSWLWREQGRFKGVILPYRTPGYAMVIITTSDKPAQPSEFAAVAGWLGGKGFGFGRGTIALPRFSLETCHDQLLRNLDRFGLAPARLDDRSLPDFTAVPQRLDRIVHKVLIKLDEMGTEAAAATAGIAVAAGIMESFSFVADKPFLFALYHETSEQLLIAGYVGNPAAA